MTAGMITPPAQEPVTVADLRAHLRLAQESEDDLLASFIMAARQEVERSTRRALITQGWRIYLDRWPQSHILRLPVNPVAEVTAVTLYDADGLPSDLDDETWLLDNTSEPARLRVSAGSTAGLRALNGIEISFTAGYGADPADVPETYRQAIRLLAAHWYEHREAGTELVMASLPLGLDRLLSTCRVPLL